MANFKMIHQFREAGSGFSEVWYREAGSLTEAAQGLSSVISFGTLFRNSLVVWDKIRISDTANNRSATIRRVNLSAPFSNSSPSVNNTALVYKVAAPTAGGSRNVWFRGLDQNAFGRAPTSGADRPDPTTLNQIFTYLLAMQNANYRVRVLQKISVPGQEYRQCSNVIAVADQGVVTVQYTGLAMNVGDRIILSQFNKKDFPGLAGKFTVQFGSTPGNAILRYNYHYAGTFPCSPARFRPETYTYAPFNLTLSDWVKLASRDTGKDPTPGRGRRSSQRIRSA